MHDRPWIEVTVETSSAGLEQIEGWLFEAGALSLTLSGSEGTGARRAAEPVLEPLPGEVRLWDHLRVTGLFDRTLSADAVHEALLRSAARQELNVPTYRLQTLVDRPWERLWLQNFRPRQFGQRLWVCPSHSTPPDPTAVNVRLDPGLAFGTGTHPSTAQCLQYLGRSTANTRRPLQGQLVVDYGCGSGILAVTAALLGAAQVLAVDIDPQALEACRMNACLNNVAARVAVHPPHALDAAADLMLANILYQPLMGLADTLAARVRAGGRLVMAGMLVGQAEALRYRYNDYFDFDPDSAADGWALMTGTRRTG